jgi:hypothetical protein
VQFGAGSRLRVIGDSSFMDCNLVSFELPATVATIEDAAFKRSRRLASFTFARDDSLVSIGSGCFAETAIEAMVLPPSVTNLGSYVFFNAISLRQLTLSPATHLGAFLCIGTQLRAITIPETVRAIEARAFMQLSTLRAVDFSRSAELTRIGSEAFAASGITQAILPQRIEVIERRAFANCANLRLFKVHPQAPFTSLLPETLASSAVVSVIAPRIRTIAADFCIGSRRVRQLVLARGDQTKEEQDRAIRIPDVLFAGFPPCSSSTRRQRSSAHANF